MATKSKVGIFLPSVSDALFLTVFLHLSLGTAILLNDNSTGAHIRAGEFMIETLSVPKHDIFSFRLPPLPWTAHEWLAEVAMGFLHQHFGLTGVVIFFSFLIALAYGLLFKMLCADRGNLIVALLLVVLVMASSQIHWLARPHAFSFVLTVAWFYILELYQNENRSYCILLPLLMLLWVNLHGGFMFGFVLLGVYLACNWVGIFFSSSSEKEQFKRRAQTLGIVSLTCLVSATINPVGYDILLFPFRLVGDRYLMDNIMEYKSPDFHGAVPFRYLLYLTLVILGISKTRLRLHELTLMVLLTHMALYAVRYIPLFGIIAAPILARQAGHLLDQTKNQSLAFFNSVSRRIALADSLSWGHGWAILGVSAVILLGASGRVKHRFDEKAKPVAAVEFLQREGVSGNVFNLDAFGDYLIYAAWPRYKVFVDGRQDVYGADRMREYDTVIRSAPGWENILEKYDVRWAFVGADALLSATLQRSAGWHLIYADRVAHIFVKNSPDNQRLIERFPQVSPSNPASP